MKFLVFYFCLPFLVKASISVSEKIQETKDCLTVNLAKTLLLLDEVADLEKIPDQQLIHWHLIRMRASVPTNQLEVLHNSLESVFHHHEHPFFKANLTSLLSGVGIYLRKKQFLEDAKISLESSHKYAMNDRQKLTLTNSLALVARQQNDYSSARVFYRKARELAIERQNHSIIAMIVNNLGMIEFDEGNFNQAEFYYRRALKGYRSIDKRSGVVTASINLLFAFMLQDKLIDNKRLYSPTATVTLAFPNQSKQALLFWIHQRFLQLQGSKLSINTMNKLVKAYKQLEDAKVRMHIHDYIAADMNIELTTATKKVHVGFNRPWFELVKRCDWIVD